MTTVKVFRSGSWQSINVKQSELPIIELTSFSISQLKEIFKDKRGINRDVSNNLVIRLKREMENGCWRPTASVIYFDMKGNLLDGQHRIAAAISANMPLKTYCFYGATLEDMKVMDTGKERKAKDRKKINNIDISETAMITLRFYCKLKQAFSQMPSTVEDELYKKYGEAAEFVCSRMASKGNLGKTGMKAALIKAYYHVGEEIVERFINVITSGISDSLLGLSDKDPAFRLREWLVLNPAEKVLHRDVFVKTLNAIKLFADGKGVRQVHAIKDPNIYPLPDEDIYIPKPEKLKIVL